MFPQSELDNYKLQVELLQEKLQRSEISRKQLEHKLEKILQKRDEQDKMVRSKAKQKYQQFLEEQQRRNERNKQLIQMLERIEQQTEALNARSERLKMMKLQYEMYFAKQVHSQTRRCLQSSINPITLMMPTSSTQPMQPTLQQPAMEDYNCKAYMESPTTHITDPYQTYATKTNFENEQFSREQMENMASKTMEMPTLANFVKRDKSDYENLRNHNVASLMQPQQLHQQAKHELINNLAKPTSMTYNKQEIPHNIIYPTVNINNTSLSSASNLLPYDKQLAELNENSKLSATTSTKFDKIQNLAKMSTEYHNLSQLPITTTTITKNYVNATNNNNTSNINANFRTLQNTQNINEIPLKATNQKGCPDSTNDLQNINQNGYIINSIPQDEVKEINSPISQKSNELKTNEEIMPKLLDKPLTSFEVEPSKDVIETSTNSSSESTNYVKRLQSEPTKQIKNDFLANNIELNSYTIPVSIENIENKIYGELVSPIQTEPVQKPENRNVKSNILENPVILTENTEIKKTASEETTIKQESDAKSISLEDSNEQEEQNAVLSNYEQTAVYDNYDNEKPSEELANSFADYENYKNLDSEVIDEGQQQQEEQQEEEEKYDYSNYDPTQYSYPGYIYDETTGEYKPDPNATAEQYATNQQYSTEEYNQQYETKDYDYNQTYTEEPTTTSTTAESIVYNNYDTAQQEISSNFTPTDSNAENQQILTQPDPNNVPFDPTAEEIATSSTKTTKPTSILSSADKNDSQKKKKRVNFIDSSETDESTAAEKLTTAKPPAAHLAGSSESDFEFSSSTEAAAKTT